MSNTTTENMKTLRTVIKTRQGLTHEWLESTLVLAKGELGLEYVEKLGDDGKTWISNGEVKIKAGDGENLFKDLPYIGSDVKQSNVLQSDILPYNSTIGMDKDVTHVIQEMIQTTIPAEKLDKDTFQAGDIAIVKRYIDAPKTETSTSTKISYTSYVYDPEIVLPTGYKDKNGELVTDENKYLYMWRAMDGNYSADNVYLTQKIKNTTSGNIGYFTKGTTKDAGTSLQSFLSGIFQEKKLPNTGDKIDKPSLSISLANNDKTTGEVGTAYTVPTATCKVLDVGTFLYGPADTGCRFSTISITASVPTYSGTTLYAKDTEKSTDSKSGELNKGATTPTAVSIQNVYTDSDCTKEFPKIFRDTAITYNFSASGTYSDSTAIPLDNLGGQCDSSEYKITGDSTSASASASRTGWRAAWYGPIPTDSTGAPIKFTATTDSSTAEAKAATSYAIKNNIVNKENLTTKRNSDSSTGSIGTASGSTLSGSLLNAFNTKGVFVAVPGTKSVSNFTVQYTGADGKIYSYDTKNMFVEQLLVGGADATESSIGSNPYKYTVLYICFGATTNNTLPNKTFENYSFYIKW